MRHKYETRAIVLSRSPVGEASAFVVLLTSELGLVRTLSQGVRKSGAKLSHALTTFAESDVVLVRGKDGWRLSGAVLVENWFALLGYAEPRARAGRVSSLLLRLVAGETNDRKLFPVVRDFFNALASLPIDMHESVEILVALRILATLGLDAGETPSSETAFNLELLAEIAKNRTGYIVRINNGLEASGL